jgi:hypothetical protein
MSAGPFTEITRHEYRVGGRRVRLYEYPFPERRTLPAALEWILSNSRVRTPPGVSIEFLYQEVSLFWRLSTRRFIAYTLQRETMTTYDASIPRRDLIFVAHTHPTPSDLPDGIVQWRTTMPSPGDTNNMMPMPNQRYSIVVHRDTRSNRIPHAFIYSRNGQVHTRRFVRDFPGAARTYIQLETEAGTRARQVGQY